MDAMDFIRKLSDIEVEKRELRENMEKALLDRLTEIAGGMDGVADIIERGGGFAVPFTILVPDKGDDAYIYVNSINIAEKPVLMSNPSYHDYYIMLYIAGDYAVGKQHCPYEGVAFSKLPTRIQTAVFKGYEDMGLFDDSRRNLFNVI